MKSFWAKLNSELKSLWDNDKLFFLVFIPIIVIVKFRSYLINWLVNDAKQTIQDTSTQDKTLIQNISKENQEADKLIQNVSQIGSEETPVGPDWYLKK